MSSSNPSLAVMLPWLLGLWPLLALIPDLFFPGTGLAIFAILGVHYALAAVFIIFNFFDGKQTLDIGRFAPSAFLLAGLLIWAIGVTWINAPNKVIGLLKLTELTAFGMVGIAAARLHAAIGDHPFETGFRALAGGLVAALLLAMAGDILFSDTFEGNRVPGFIHIRIIGFSAAIAIALATGMLTAAEGKPEVSSALVLLCLGWTVLFWSASRGGIVALVLSFALLAVLCVPLRRTWKPWLATLAVGFGLSIFIPGEGNSGAATIFAHQMNVDSLSAGRWELWKQVLGFVADRPWAGHGYAQYYTLAVDAGGDPERVMPHTHNIVLEGWLAIGAPAALILALVALSAWLQWLRDLASATGELRISSTLLTSMLFAYAFVDGVYFYPKAAFPFAIAAGVLAGRSATLPKSGGFRSSNSPKASGSG